jgi:hypothetical protein
MPSPVRAECEAIARHAEGVDRHPIEWSGAQQLRRAALSQRGS